MFLLSLKMYFFLSLWLRWVSIAVRVLFLASVRRGYSVVAALGLLVAVASLVAEGGL